MLNRVSGSILSRSTGHLLHTAWGVCGGGGCVCVCVCVFSCDCNKKELFVIRVNNN